MEANEVQELQEQHEHAAGHAGHGGEEESGRRSLKPVSFAMSVIAVMVAVVTVLGHRTHTEAVLMQARASDQWNFYQAKRIRQNDTMLAEDMLSVVAVGDKAAAVKILNGYKSHQDKWTADLNDEQNKAHEYEDKVEHAERKATKYDLSEALLEIGLVVTSITLLTRQRVYWLLGMLFGAGGLLIAAQGLLLH